MLTSHISSSWRDCRNAVSIVRSSCWSSRKVNSEYLSKCLKLITKECINGFFPENPPEFSEEILHIGATSKIEFPASLMEKCKNTPGNEAVLFVINGVDGLFTSIEPWKRFLYNNPIKIYLAIGHPADELQDAPQGCWSAPCQDWPNRKDGRCSIWTNYSTL